MKVLLLFVVANVFAFGTSTAAEAQSNSNDAHDSLSQIEKLFTKLLTRYPAYQLKNETYPPIEEDVTFWCVKPDHKDIQQITVDDPDVTTKLDFSKPINFFIHGWLGFIQPDGVRWFENEATNWAHFEDSNACTVDWSRLARYNYSITATKHVRMVADATVDFMKFLTQHGMNISEVSIAGFSLGGQIAGFIGAAFSEQKLAAIYGLDPAGPGFTVPRDFGIDERLDPTDATYVQCIFTNAYVLASGVDCGHGNFYINGGTIQPNCYLDITCSHLRAFIYFDESFDPEHKFIGEQCESASKKFFLDIVKQKCSDVTDRMGIYTSKLQGKFFVTTNSKPPYARG